MSPASHMVGRLRKLYGFVLGRGLAESGPRMEPLEQRQMLSVVPWTGLGDGKNVSDPLNWPGNAVPGADDDVVISVAGSPTILFGAAAGDGHLAQSMER